MDLLSEDINDFCFIDTETRSLKGLTNEKWGNVKTTSTGRYARSVKVIVVTYAIGDGEIKDWVLDDFDNTLKWRDLPPDLATFMQRVRAGKAWFVAFNSGFDLAVMNHGMVRDSKRMVIEVEEMLDAMAQAAYSNLPFALDAAAKTCGHKGKQEDGKALIKMFCSADGETPQSRPEEWQQFISYARQDIDALRVVWTSTMPLPRWQWQEFWASERINYRGMPIDVPYVEAAAELAAEFRAQVKERVLEITDGELYSINQHAAIAQWVYDRVEEIPDAQDVLVKRYDEDAEGGELLPAKIGCDRFRATRLIAMLEQFNEEEGLTDEEADVLELLRLKEFGASATVGKFAKMVDAVTVDGRLPNQYVFNGASQTGRFSSRGVQMHNLTRMVVPEELLAIEFIMDRCGVEAFEAKFGDVGKALSRLVRPAIVAEPGKTLIWGDWSNIEARTLPWLAVCEERLDVFRKVDRDPSNPDVYVISAAGMDNVDPQELWAAYKAKDKAAANTRQKGKIAELSLGFGGASGALLSMAAGYGMSFSDGEAAQIVNDWRRANEWARGFWDDLWSAFTSARARTGTPYSAGRVTYLGVEGYLGNVSVLCFLPDGRTLCYRDVRWERREVKNPKTDEMEMREQFTFGRGYGRVGLWYGILAENVTQAAAASILRRTMCRLEYDDFVHLDDVEIVAHTHDEIVVQCPDDPETIAKVKKIIYDRMVEIADWMERLPLEADLSQNEYYTKHED